MFKSEEEDQVPFYNGGAVFLDDFNHHVVEPLKNKDLIHPLYAPHMHMFAVFGRSGMQKGRGVERACRDAGMFRVSKVTVDKQRTTLAVDVIETLFEKISKGDEPLPEKYDVLIIEHADLLVMRPDNQITNDFMLYLKQQALEKRVMVFACFDKNPLEFSQHIPEHIKEYRAHVMSQFSVFFFFPQPPPSYKRQCFEELFANATAHFLEKGKDLRVSLSDEDYANLDSYSTGCSPINILQFLQPIFLHAAFPGGERNPFKAAHKDGSPIVITLDVLRGYMFTALGNTRILTNDAYRTEENNLSVLCGKGSVALNRPTEQLDAKKKLQRMTKTDSHLSNNVLKRERATQEEEEEKEKRIKRNDDDEKTIMEAFSGVN